MTLKLKEPQDAEQAIQLTQAKKLPQYIAALSVCLGSVAAGTVLGWTANISISKGEFNDILISDTDMGWIGSFATLGAMTMCFPIGIICDKLGRKLSMLLLVIPFIAGWLIILFAENLAMIYVGRFITGMAGGAFCISAPMYTSEIAQKEIRGMLGSFFQLLLTIGILFAYVVAYFVTNPKTYTIVCAVWPLVFGVAFFFQPETPVYLLKKKRDDDARESLRRLRGEEYDVDAEMKEIRMMLEEDERIKMPFLQAIKKRAAKKAAVVAFGMMFFQQLSGVNAIIFYTGTIFGSTNTGLDKKQATMIFGAMQVIATLVSSLVVDRLGRKFLLIGSDLLMAVSSILLGIYFTIKDEVDSIGFLPIFALCLFIVVFSLGYGPIPWIISAEVFPAEIKTVASSAAGTFNWLMAFVVTKVYFDLTAAVGEDVTFYIFGGISIVGALFIAFCVPETKGKSLDEIQRELSGEKPSAREGVDNQGYSK